jgi:hypothetical protein
LSTFLTVIVVGVAALAFYAWAVRREHRLRQIALSAEAQGEPHRVAIRSKLPPPLPAKRATADEVDVLTGGATL